MRFVQQHRWNVKDDDNFFHRKKIKAAIKVLVFVINETIPPQWLRIMPKATFTGWESTHRETCTCVHVCGCACLHWHVIIKKRNLCMKTDVNIYSWYGNTHKAEYLEHRRSIACLRCNSELMRAIWKVTVFVLAFVPDDRRDMETLMSAPPSCTQFKHCHLQKGKHQCASRPVTLHQHKNCCIIWNPVVCQIYLLKKVHE